MGMGLRRDGGRRARGLGWWVRGCAFAAVVGLAAWLAGDSAKASLSKAAPPEALSTRSELPPFARVALSERMRRHGDQMVQLQRSVILLRYEDVERAVQEILEEPRIARPEAADRNDFNAALPEAFFSLQDELYQRTEELGAAAAQRSDPDLGVAYGRLAETCVACHSAYLGPRGGAGGR